MKKISTLFCSFSIALAVSAQSPTAKIILAPQQQLKFVSTIKANVSQEMMGQSMETVMDVSNAKKIIVKEAGADEYKIDVIATHVKMNMSLMGQEKSFDSNNQNDMAGEAKDLGKDINVAKPLILSADGKCRAAQKPSPEKTDDDANPMNGMMQQMLGGGAEEITTAAYFMLIPQGKKIGDAWTETTAAGTTKTVWNYTLDSIVANIAVLKITAKETTNSTVNAMGMDMNINLSNDITETRKVDLLTGVLVNSTSTKKISGSIDVMGQSVPMNGTATTIITTE